MRSCWSEGSVEEGGGVGCMMHVAVVAVEADEPLTFRCDCASTDSLCVL